VTVVLALASALLVGGADFIGGITSRRAVAVRIAATAQLIGLVLAVPAAIVVGAERVTAFDAGWSVASGLVVGIGLVAFYGAMARGTISVVAPLAAMIGASVPVGYALVRGERPGTVVLAGLALAVLAIALVSVSRETDERARAGIGLAIGAGVLFGLFYVFLSRAHEDAGLWPVVLSRAGSGVGLLVVALAVTRGLDPGRPAWRAVGAIGVLEVAAAVTLLLALQSGPVSVASVIASLYPVSTTFLAATLLHERLQPTQVAGVLLAFVAIVLVSTG